MAAELQDNYEKTGGCLFLQTRPSSPRYRYVPRQEMGISRCNFIMRRLLPTFACHITT